MCRCLGTPGYPSPQDPGRPVSQKRSRDGLVYVGGWWGVGVLTDGSSWGALVDQGGPSLRISSSEPERWVEEGRSGVPTTTLSVGPCLGPRGPLVGRSWVTPSSSGWVGLRVLPGRGSAADGVGPGQRTTGSSCTRTLSRVLGPVRVLTRTLVVGSRRREGPVPVRRT